MISQMGDKMPREDMLASIIKEIVEIIKKYNVNFIVYIFDYYIIVENNTIILVDDFTNEEKVIDNDFERGNNSISEQELCMLIINIIENYQQLYQKKVIEDSVKYLNGELMSYSTYCPLKYKIYLKDLTIDRNESGAWILDANGVKEKLELQSATQFSKIDSKKKEILLFFSGGRDSMLAACRLIKQGYYVSMISFDNGSEVGLENIRDTANRLISRYGSKCCRYLGSYYMGDIKQSLQYYFDNTSYKNIYNEVGNIDFNQIQCITCRSAMYMAGIILCKIYNINVIAEGARKCQLFAIEQPIMIDEYKSLLDRYGIELLLPVYELESDWNRRLELQDCGFLPKTLEAVCTIGLPMKEELTDEELDIHNKAYQKKILPSINRGLDILLKNK